MRFVNLKKEDKNISVNDTVYTTSYYKFASAISGVTDESYPNFDENKEGGYALGEYVIVPELKKIFRAGASSLSTHPLADSSHWIDYGPFNSYKMFACDEFIGSQTVGNDMVLEFDFSLCDTIALIDTEFISARVELINNDENETVFNQIIYGSDFGSSDFFEYFFKNDLNYKTRIVFSDLNWLPNSTLKITFDGECKIGTIGFGLAEELGMTISGSSLSFEDRSKIKTDEVTGYREVIRYGNVRVLDCEIMFDTDDFNNLTQKVENIIGKNILFVPATTDKFTESIQIGYIENFNLPMENLRKSQTNTQIIGVTK